MEINNIFSLGFKVNADFSNFIVIDASTGAITATDIEQENACSFYVSMNTKKAKFLKVLKASNFNTGTVFFYDKDKKYLGNSEITPDSEVSTPESGFTYVAFSLTNWKTNKLFKDFCEFGIQVNPHYKDLKKQYKKEDDQLFFRESIDGTIELFDVDYGLVKEADIESVITFNIYTNGTLYSTNSFVKTDCEFDHFRGSVKIKLTPYDRYTNILNAYENTYDLLKLPIAKNIVNLTKRCIIQIYIQGENTITNYAGGTYWEDEVNEVIDSADALKKKYYFSEGPSFNEISLTGFNYDINTSFRCIEGSSVWNSTSSVIVNGTKYKVPCSIKFTKTNSKGTIWSGSTEGYVLSTGTSKTIADGDGTTNYLKYDMYRIEIYTGFNGTGQRIYQSVNIYANDSDFKIAQGPGLYQMVKIDQESPYKQPEPSSFYLGENVIVYNIWGRLLCSVDKDASGQEMYDLPYDDFATERANFKKCIGLAFSQEQGTLVHFVQSTETQDEPTAYGINDYNEYFVSPVMRGYSYNIYPYPLARSAWGNTSLWIGFEENTDLPAFSVENWSKQHYKVIQHRDCMEIGAVIKGLLAEIDKNIKFESTADYSKFLYDTESDIEGGYGKNGLKIFITQKSNVLKGEYDQAAQTAEITFKQLMDMLKKCFKCYWYIDSANRFRIEHLRYFNNGLSYEGPVMQYDLTKSKDRFNRKQALYGQREVTFDKTELKSRYEFSWSDSVTEAMGEGFTVDVNSNYISKDDNESIAVELFSSDIDFMMFSPSNFSEDGFALMITDSTNTVPIVYDEIYTKKNSYTPMALYIQNYYASFINLFNNYMYDMPARSISTSIDNDSTVRYIVDAIKKCMKHDIQFQVMQEPDLYRLIGTNIGSGYIDSLEVDIDTRLVNATLLYEPG